MTLKFGLRCGRSKSVSERFLITCLWSGTLARSNGLASHLFGHLKYIKKLHSSSLGLLKLLEGLVRVAHPVQMVGMEHIGEERVFVFTVLQARNPKWTGRVFFAKYDGQDAWMDQLKPAFGDEKFFFEDELKVMKEDAMRGKGSSGQQFQETMS